MTAERDTAKDSATLDALRRRGAAIGEGDLLLTSVEARIDLGSEQDRALQAPVLGKIDGLAYLYLTTHSLVLSGPWGTICYGLDKVRVSAVQDAYRCQLDLDGDLVLARGITAITDVSRYIAAVHEGQPDQAERIQEEFLAGGTAPKLAPTGWAYAVQHGYVGLGVGVLAVLGAIPTNNAGGYALGSAAIVLGGFAWLRGRRSI